MSNATLVLSWRHVGYSFKWDEGFAEQIGSLGSERGYAPIADARAALCTVTWMLASFLEMTIVSTVFAEAVA